MKHIFTIFLFIFILFFSNCQTTEIILEQEGAEIDVDEAPINEQHKYVSLALGVYEYSKAIEPACSNVQKILIKRNIPDAVFYFFLGGIYTPRTIYLYCKEK